MRHNLRFVFMMAATAFLSVAAYIVLHESGHALVAALCGAANIRISVVRACARWTGGHFTAGTSSLCHAAGAGLPLCVSWFEMLLNQKARKCPAYQMASFFFFLAAAGGALVWVLLPVRSVFAPWPDDTEDAAKFLQSSGFPPMAVALVTALAILLSVFLAEKKGILRGWLQIVKAVRADGPESRAAWPKKTIRRAAAAVLAAVFAVAVLELPGILTKPLLSFTAEGEIPKEEIQRAFEISEKGEYRFRIELEAAGLLADVRILDSGQEPVYRLLADRASASGTVALEPGRYTFVLICLTNQEMLERCCAEEKGCFADADPEALRAVFQQEAQLSRFLFEMR